MTESTAMAKDLGSTLVHPPGRLLRVDVEIAAKTDPGKARDNNEDQFLVAKLAKSMRVCASSLPQEDVTRFSDEEGHLMIVADGMGGAAAGEEASAMAVRTVETFVLETVKWFLHHGRGESDTTIAELKDALSRADRSIFDKIQDQPRLAGMGTTLTMGYSVGTDLFVVHAGDSRAYLLRNGELKRVTTDHTLVQILVDQGTISAEDARTHARRNVVTNVIGGPRPGVFAEVRKIDLRDGDLVLFCSDGLSEVVDDDRIGSAMIEGGSSEAISERLIRMALDGGGPDNVTVIVARFSMR